MLIVPFSSSHSVMSKMQWHHNKMWTFDAMDDVMTIHVFVKGYPLIVEQSPLFLEIYPLFLEQLNSPYYDAMPRCRCHMEWVNYISYYL